MTIVFTHKGRLYADTLSIWDSPNASSRQFEEICKFRLLAQHDEIWLMGKRVFGYAVVGDASKANSLLEYVRLLAHPPIGGFVSQLKQHVPHTSTLFGTPDTVELVMWTTDPSTLELMTYTVQYSDMVFTYSDDDWSTVNKSSVWGSGVGAFRTLYEYGLYDPNSGYLSDLVDPQTIFAVASWRCEGVGGHLQELEPNTGLAIDHPYLTPLDYAKVNLLLVNQHLNQSRPFVRPKYDLTGHHQHYLALRNQFHHDLTNSYEIE